jgi:hypothetical protein
MDWENMINMDREPSPELYAPTGTVIQPVGIETESGNIIETEGGTIINKDP